MRELLIGCGNNLNKKVWLEGEEEKFQNVVTLDIDPDSQAEVIWDLEVLPYPFKDEEFDEIHAYEILEHTGQQGDYKFFFKQFDEFYRILKPNGRIFITVPWWGSVWAWGDPGHKRILNEGTFKFLDRSVYQESVGKNPMTDYRNIYHGHFSIVVGQRLGSDQSLFILEKDYVYK